MMLVVYGRPCPQGSMRAFASRSGRIVVTSDNLRMKPWRQEIASVAIQARAEVEDGPVAVWMTFYFLRPKSARKRAYPSVKPDADKLCRAVLDALTGICYRDDAQVVDITIAKRYGGIERAEIEIRAV